ncbi:MAG: AMP-dependent synthetase/ligase [Thermoanaerobaculia bacterium]
MEVPSIASPSAPRTSSAPDSPDAGIEARHVAHVMDEKLGERGDGTALRYLAGGQWRDISWRELAAKVRDLSSALVEAGVAEGDRVAILAANRPEWTMADLAILRVRGVSVPIHATSSASQVAFILKDSGARFVFVDGGEPTAKILSAIEAGVPLERVVAFGGGTLPKGQVFAGFEETLARGRTAGREEEVAARLSRATPDDLLTLLYTSGTTGEPKGVMLPHSAFSVTCAFHDLRLPPIGQDDVSLCFLPLSHIFERAWTFYILYRGAVTAYCEDPKKVSEVLPQVKPTLMCAVPRLYEKAYTKLQERVRSSSAPKRALFRWAIRTGHAVSLRTRAGEAVPRLLALRHALADRLVLAKVRAAFGGRPRLFPCAGAPLAPEIEEFFHSVGVFVCQGYGLTETTATVTCHDPSRFHVGTVGSPLPGVEVRISEQGEVLVKGRTVMKGYWNRPEETAAVFRDGWLRTGDAGEICEDGTLKITDRIKDLIKTAGGRYVAPQHVETTIGADPLVEQVAVIGEGRSYVTALVVPAFEALENWARAAGISFAGRDELVRNERVLDLIKRTIEERTKDLAPWEKVRKFSLLTKEFSVEGGSMTPTQKVRRRAAAELYKDRIEEMYTGD